MPKPIEIPREPKTYTSNEELYLTGLRLEQFRNATINPMDYYEEALKRDSLDYRVNTVLGIGAAKREAGRSCSESGTGRETGNKKLYNAEDGESFITWEWFSNFKTGTGPAADNFWKATWYKGYQSAAYFILPRLPHSKRFLKSPRTA